MNKKILSCLLVLSMLIGMLAAMPLGVMAASDTIEINSVSDWMEYVNGKNDLGSKNIVVYADELNFSGQTLAPITNFSGTFDGKGVVIKNVQMSGDGDVGLFCTSSGTYRNVVITDSTFSSKGQWNGSLLCCTNNTTTIENVYVSGSVKVTTTVSGSAYTGGIVGGMGSSSTEYKLTITDCVFAGTVEAEDGTYMGGIIGDNNGKSSADHDIDIKNTMVLGAVYGDGKTSGFVGYSKYGDVTYENCIYAGGKEGDYFISYPFNRDVKSVTATNCYTAFVCSDNTVYATTPSGGGAKKYTDDDSGVTYLNEGKTGEFDPRAALIGLEVDEIEGFTRRAEDIMIPDGLVGIAPALYASSYTVTWKNFDGTVLDTEDYVCGAQPEYKGETPERAEDDQFTYSFEGWSPALTEVMGDTVYTANFKKSLRDNIPADCYDVWDGTSDDSFSQFGNGTAEEPYIIATAEQWANMAENVSKIDGKYFKLAVNLDFNNIDTIKPISADGDRLEIYLDGQGHTIKGVSMSAGDGVTGLFGDIWGSANPADAAENTSYIKNLVITSSEFRGEGWTGVIAGEVSGNTLFENIYVDSSVTIISTGSVNGGLVGGCYYASSWISPSGIVENTVTFNDCVFAGTLLSTAGENGGIIGNGNSKADKDKNGDPQYEIFHIVINNCLVTGCVAPDQGNSSGFVGYNKYTHEVTEGEGEEAVVVATYNASVTINNSVYAGGAQEVYFNNRPFIRVTSECNVTNSYTTHTDSANRVYGDVECGGDSGVALVKFKELLGNNAVDISGWTKRAGDMIIPDGVADFAPLTYTQRMMDGASVRLDNPTGLRFRAVLGGDFLNLIMSANEGETVRYGILITPTDYIEKAGGIFTVEALNSLTYSTKYILGYADKLVSGGEADGYYEFTAVLANVKEYNYERAFSAIAFVSVDDGNGNVEYYYSDYNASVNSRTISAVAKAAYNDISSKNSGEYKYEIVANSGVYSPYKATQRDLLPAFFGQVAANVNFMTYNIRNVEGGDSLLNDPLTFEYDGRADAVVNYILGANPDVIGIQEASVKTHAYSNDTLSWFTYLGDDTITAGLTANGYACYKGMNILPDDEDKEMYNPIYYNAEKYSFVTGGFAYLSADGTQQAYDGEYRGVTYVVLEDNDTGLQFVYVNVHMTRQSGENYQDDVAGYLKTFLESLNYDCPIILGGDFNGSYSDYKGYDESFWGGTAVIARDKAINKSMGCSTVDSFTTLGTSSGSIDLYFALNTDSVDFYNCAVIDNIVNGQYPSDHLPVKLVVALYGEKTN